MSLRYQINDPCGNNRVYVLVDNVYMKVLDTFSASDSDKYIEVTKKCDELNEAYRNQSLEENIDEVIKALTQ